MINKGITENYSSNQHRNTFITKCRKIKSKKIQQLESITKCNAQPTAVSYIENIKIICSQTH